MPRIEIIPADWENSREKKMGDGSPTVDVCWSCKEEFVDGQPLDEDTLESLADVGRRIFPNGSVVGSTEVEHPPYEDSPDDMLCECCGDVLTGQDNDG